MYQIRTLNRTKNEVCVHLIASGERQEREKETDTEKYIMETLLHRGAACIIDTHNELLNWIIWPENRKSSACYDLKIGLIACYSNEKLYFELGAMHFLRPLLLLPWLLFVVIENTLEGQR